MLLDIMGYSWSFRRDGFMAKMESIEKNTVLRKAWLYTTTFVAYGERVELHFQSHFGGLT